LFEKLNLPVQKKTKKKTGYSTDVEVLTTLARKHDLPALVLRHRTLAKLKSTYADALLEMIHPQTGRIHTSFNQTVAATGRLSSSDPNLQNIPIRTEEGREIRKAFVPREGWTIAFGGLLPDRTAYSGPLFRGSDSYQGLYRTTRTFTPGQPPRFFRFSPR
jgi:DNA polymerase-1